MIARLCWAVAVLTATLSAQTVPAAITLAEALAGMIPLALGIGAGSQMLQPLAIAVTSLILSLLVTPAVSYYLGGHKHAAT